jgi:beta-N-acetylhexosaminidase
MCLSLVRLMLTREQMDGDGNFDGLSAMGFSALHNFEEVSVDAASWTMVPTS